MCHDPLHVPPQDAISGGQFGTGVSKGAYYCADTATTEECKDIVNQVATWQYADIVKGGMPKLGSDTA